ncbi:MAG: hypothetical protein WD810_03415 [Solirubrobacterales bacterium]
MRWLVAIVLAAAAGSVAYSLGAGPEVAYIIRSIVRHLAGGY